MNNKITKITSKACPIIGDNIDTDQIIPSKYLKAITFTGIEKGLFYDLRFDENNKSKNFSIDDEKYKNHSIYIVNENFGCGSSREHAPQAIKRSNIQAIIGVTYSEIFFGNCVSIGLPCFCVSSSQAKVLQKFVIDNPEEKLDIDVSTLTLTYGDNTLKLELPSQIQELFLKGTYDPMEVLLSRRDNIIKFQKDMKFN
jgi:3-isopropylmalate/(R)-2-methylmalate dehydratase small subunit